MRYATLAAVPISQYARQYGPNEISVNERLGTFLVTLPAAKGSSYNDSDLQGWVNQIAKANHLPNSACVVVLNPLGITNTHSPTPNTGYHYKANLPYIFCSMAGQNITVAYKPFYFARHA